VGRLAPRASVTLGCIQAISAGKGPLNNCQKAMVLCSILAALLEALFEETIKGPPPPPPPHAHVHTPCQARGGGRGARKIGRAGGGGGLGVCFFFSASRGGFFGETSKGPPPPPSSSSDLPLPSSCRKVTHLSRVPNVRFLLCPQEPEDIFVDQSHRIASRVPPRTCTSAECRRI